VNVREPGLALRPVIAVFNEGMPAFRSPLPDELVAEAPGVYEAAVRIPAHLLNDRVYSLKVGVFLRKGGEERSLVRHNALSFRVFDTAEQDSARGTYGNQLDGVVRPRLAWTAGRYVDGGPSVAGADSPGRSRRR
jgi:hypothetical protein